MEKILIVDDAEINRELLREMLQDQYEIEEAEDGMIALQILKKRRHEFSVVLLDLIMPKIDGLKVLKVMKEQKWLTHLPVIVISGDEGKKAQRESMMMGATDFIMKPYDAFLLQQQIKNTVELTTYRRSLEQKVKAQTGKLNKQYQMLLAQAKKLREVNEKVIDVFATIVENRHLESGQHIQRVKVFTKILAEKAAKEYPEYGLDEEKISRIVSASALHDIGKIAIPDNILLKPGKLTADEFEYMKSHSARGAEMIKKIEGLWDADYEKVSYDICRYHHERYDGKGYPDGLKGEEIPISAQLVSIADVYDALSSKRVYKDAFSLEKAYQMILDGECGIFSPKLLECFRLAKKELEEQAIALKDELETE